jgi:hypothetical protein
MGPDAIGRSVSLRILREGRALDVAVIPIELA